MSRCISGTRLWKAQPAMTCSHITGMPCRQQPSASCASQWCPSRAQCNLAQCAYTPARHSPTLLILDRCTKFHYCIVDSCHNNSMKYVFRTLFTTNDCLLVLHYDLCHGYMWNKIISQLFQHLSTSIWNNNISAHGNLPEIIS